MAEEKSTSTEPPAVVPVLPYHPILGLLIPEVTRRIMEFVEAHPTEFSAKSTAKAILLPLYQENPRQAVLAFVNQEHKMVGHAAISIEGDEEEGRYWVFIQQVQIDPPGHDQLMAQVLDWCQEWGHTYSEKWLIPRGLAPIREIMGVTHRSHAAWARSYGFELVRHVMRKEIE